MRTKFALMVGLLVCSCGVASAQVREEWVVRHDGLASQGDGARHIAVDQSGNVYVTGGTCTLIWPDSPEFGCTGGAWTTLKYDANGNKLWSASYGGPANFAGSPAGVAVDSAGNVYITGSMCLYAVFDWVSLWCSGSDYTTIKYGTNGNQLWTAHHASPVDDAGASAIVLDAAGNVHVTGSSMGVDYVHDYVTIKYDTNGNQLWLARYNGPENGGGSASAIALGAAGAVYVTGYSAGAASTETATIKYDANGNQMWAARSGEDAAVAIAVKAGSVYVTGFATIKYDEDGHELWVARNDAPGMFYANALAMDGSGDAYVTGVRWGASTSPDYETIRYDTDGNERWVARYNGPGDGYDGAAAIGLDVSGNVYVTGDSLGADTSSDYATIKYDNDGNELWVVRYDGPWNGPEIATAIVLGSSNVYITGFSWDGDTQYDYATIKYSQSPEPTGPLTPTVTFGQAPTPTYLVGNFTVTAITTNTDSSALRYSAVSGPCATVDASAGTFSSNGAGICRVEAAGGVTANFRAASAQQDVTIAKAAATVTLSNLTQTYTGSPLTPTATTVPPGLAIVWTNAPQTYAGSHAVIATVNHANHQGSASGTFAIKPSAPTNLNAVGGKGNVMLSWTQSTSPGVMWNKVYRSTTNGGPYAVTASIGANTSYIDSRVTRGTTYYYVVAATTVIVESAGSNQDSSKPK